MAVSEDHPCTMKQASSYDRQFFCVVRGSDMVATGQEIVREKNFFQVREVSGNFSLSQGKANL